MSYSPTGFQVDLEFTAGVWTNVTSLVRSGPGVNTHFGRTTVNGTPQVASCDFVLDNADGRFTALNAASAYYPNVKTGIRCRVSYNSGSTPRFVGFVKSLTPMLDGGVAPLVAVTATDRSDVLSRLVLTSSIVSATLALSPTGYWPLTDSATVTIPGNVLELTGNQNHFWNYEATNGGAGIYQFGGNGIAPHSDGGTSFNFGAPTGSFPANAQAYWRVPIPFALQPTFNGMTLTAWSNAGGATMAYSPVAATTGVNPTRVGVGSSGASFTDTTGTFGVLNAGVTGPHHFALTFSAGHATLYVDSVLYGTHPTTFNTGSVVQYLYFSALAPGTGSTDSAVSHVAYWNSVLSPAQIAELYNAGGTGFAGESSGARTIRVLGYAGLTGADYNVGTGQETMGPAVLAGKDVVSALNDVTATESGGAATFVDVDGRVRFNDRSYRSTSTPVMTIDSTLNIHPNSWAPVVDSLGLINQSTVTRDGGAPFIYSDGTATPATDSLTTYAYSDDSSQFIAQWRVTSTKSAFRFPQLVINLARSSNAATLFAALGSVTIGSLIRITNIPSLRANGSGNQTRIFHTTQLDVYVEGWSEQISDDNYIVTLDLSPAVPRFIMDASGAYNRLVETAGSMTLNGAITSGATSISVATSGGNPTFSTAAGDYSPTPLFIKIDEEIIGISTAPGSSATPQTLTVSGRGSLGTFADAHASGAVVSVYTGALVL